MPPNSADIIRTDETRGIPKRESTGVEGVALGRFSVLVPFPPAPALLFPPALCFSTFIESIDGLEEGLYKGWPTSSSSLFVTSFTLFMAAADIGDSDLE